MSVADIPSYSWTQPCCAVCFDKRYPGRTAVRVTEADGDTCCDCGRLTTGIYIRVDPYTVPYPTRLRDG